MVTKSAGVILADWLVLTEPEPVEDYCISWKNIFYTTMQERRN